LTDKKTKYFVEYINYVTPGIQTKLEDKVGEKFAKHFKHDLRYCEKVISKVVVLIIYSTENNCMRHMAN
jgi:hypothetical protein